MNNSTSHVYQELLNRAGEATPRPRIEPVQRLAELLGSPQHSYPIIHVAGTNGKTSTARAIESILRAHGLRTGLFTSPHLMSFAERIQIDGEHISDQALADGWQEMQIALDLVDSELSAQGKSPITFFEALAVLAFVSFADAPVEVAVIEVGMGGEWDATNIADAQVAVFTPISFDHVSTLGDSISEIAGTKSGIIKPGSLVVSAHQEADAIRQLQTKSASFGTKVAVEGIDFSLREDRGGVGGRLIEVNGVTGTQYDATYIPVFGEHQSHNVLLAIAAVEAFFGYDRPIPQQVLEEGLAQLTSPGRLQPIGHKPSVLVDAAHNPQGAQTLATSVKDSFQFEGLTLVVGVLKDKDIEGILAPLLPLAEQVYVTGLNSDRSVNPEDIAEIVSKISAELPLITFDTVGEALSEARAWASEGEMRGVLIAGSVVLAGEAIAHAHAEGWAVSS